MRILLIIFIFSFSSLKASDVSEWFDKESNLFLEIMNNNEGTESENYERYIYFVTKNFAIKSIAYGLIGENTINKSSKSDLSLYLDVFNDYLDFVSIKKTQSGLEYWNYLLEKYKKYSNLDIYSSIS